MYATMHSFAKSESTLSDNVADYENGLRNLPSDFKLILT